MKNLSVLILFAVLKFTWAQAADSSASMSSLMQKVGELNRPMVQCSPDAIDPCKDMSTFACQGKSLNDQTGVSLSKDQLDEKYKNLYAQSRDRYQAAVFKLLNDPNAANDGVRKYAVLGTRQDQTTACLSTSEAEKQKCYEQAALIIASSRARKEFSDYLFNTKSDPAAFDFSAIAALQKEPAFKTAILSTKQQNADSLMVNDLAEQIRTEIFPSVKSLVLKRLETLIPNGIQRAAIEKKVKAMQFSGTVCDSEGDSIDARLTPNAMYDPTHNTIQICNGLLLTNSSQFKIVASMAHEMTHSFAPCALSSIEGFAYSKPDDLATCEKEYVLPNVLSCLRSKESIAALRKSWVMDSENDRKSGVNTLCDDQDQINESMSDWMAAEVLPEYIRTTHPKLTKADKTLGYANAMKSLCRESMPYHGDPHPDGKKRIDQILMANPKVRADLGCAKGEAHYCDPNEVFVGTPIKGVIEKARHSMRASDHP